VTFGQGTVLGECKHCNEVRFRIKGIEFSDQLLILDWLPWSSVTRFSIAIRQYELKAPI